MKKRVLIFMANLAIAGICVIAQPPQPGGAGKPPSPEERLKHVSERMEKELKLTPAQKEKLSAAYKDFFAAIEKQKVKEGKPELPPPPPPPPPVSIEVAEKLSKVRDEKIKSVLSADQFKKYTEIEKTMRPPMPPGKPGEQKPPPPDKKQ
jgi:hypothetical protein